MATETFLVRTMSDTVETDIQRVFTIANEILPRYEMPPLTFTQLRKIADGPFDLFLIPLIFVKEYQQDHNLPFNEAKRVEKKSAPAITANQSPKTNGQSKNEPTVTIDDNVERSDLELALIKEMGAVPV